MNTPPDNKHIILHKAIELFAAKGYDGVGVQEIVDSVKLTKPTLYHYFTNKEGLLTEAIKIYSLPLMNALKNETIYQGDLPLTLDKIFLCYFTFAEENKTFFRFFLSLYFTPEQSIQHEIISKIHLRQFELLENMFKEAAKQHGNMRGRHIIYAASLIGTIHTYINYAFNGHISLDKHLRQKAVHQFQYGIYS